jgi:hypothetical protein
MTVAIDISPPICCRVRKLVRCDAHNFSIYVMQFFGFISELAPKSLDQPPKPGCYNIFWSRIRGEGMKVDVVYCQAKDVQDGLFNKHQLAEVNHPYSRYQTPYKT